MLDFVKVTENVKNNGRVIELIPTYNLKRRSKDIMTKGGDFYAIWDEANNIWETEFNDALRLIDDDIDIYYKNKYGDDASRTGITVIPRYVGSLQSSNKQVDVFKQFLKDYKYSPVALDSNLTFLSDKTSREDYASKRLTYDIKRGSINSYDEMMSTLYSKEERRKLEWAIGSILSGDSKDIQKFIVLYGKGGTGKSTVLNIIQKLFEGYWSPFKAADLANASKDFSLEAFKNNPLVSIEHDGDLSRIDDNTRLNSIVSHENMLVNEKYKTQYKMKFNSMLFLGSNKPVKITDGRSGLLRRLIDVYPSGDRIDFDRYNQIIRDIEFEIPAIAWHCLNVYKRMGCDYYNSYIPERMKDVTDHFYDFIMEHIDELTSKGWITLSKAWSDYKEYCDNANVSFPYPKSKFKQEMLVYFTSLEEDYYPGGSLHLHNVYIGFHIDKSKLKEIDESGDDNTTIKTWLEFKTSKHSKFDTIMECCSAQYATDRETPSVTWEKNKDVLAGINPTKLHYVMVPQNHIVIDFDLKDESGKKSFEKNFEAASKWPKTYAELSKSGAGIHLHYNYNGDVNLLSRVYDKDIEIKVFTGNSSLRRKLTKCNDMDISEISSGLPLKELKGDKMVNFDTIKDEKHLRALIIKNLKKEIHPGTKPSVDFIRKLLDDAYNSGMHYDVSDLYPDVSAFALNSTNHAQYCLEIVEKMKFQSEEAGDNIECKDDNIIFYDIEVFPNLFLINWKYLGDHPMVRMINPSPEEVKDFLNHKLVGFNCRRYDNHICYARTLGCDNAELFERSQRIINGSDNGFFGEAYNLSYTDIYDYAKDKMSLKKWEIKLGIHHHELGLPWDQPVPEELWEKVAEYCDDDVYATEAVWNATQPDFLARKILVAICEAAGMKACVNDTTNMLTTKIIFGNDKKPDLVYTDLTTGKQSDPEYQRDDIKGAFPEYRYENGKNMFGDLDVSRGGLVIAREGMYQFAKTYDVAGMHPASIRAMNAFGKYTKRFADIVDARLAIKHKDYEAAKSMLNGALSPFLGTPEDAKQLAGALKIAVNSVYGLTSATFDNPFRDRRNTNNIVALRGALFMATLEREVIAKGFTVIHIKTDSIKVLNPSQEIEDFIISMGKNYGYEFEIEHVFEKICLVNKAVYIAKLDVTDPEWIADCEEAKKDGKPEPTRWTATGAQFAEPYVFKKLFSKEEITFNDLCTTKEVKGSLYLDMNENLPDVTLYEEEMEHRKKYKEGKLKTPYKYVQLQSSTDEEIESIIAGGHSYQFVGKIGLFCPIKKGCGGGTLYRVQDGKYYAVSGTSGYRWLESEIVMSEGREGDVDTSYFDDLCKDAINDINKLGDFDAFVDDAFKDLPFIPKHKGDN